jgi:hypothetical protein
MQFLQSVHSAKAITREFFLVSRMGKNSLLKKIHFVISLNIVDICWSSFPTFSWLVKLA